MSMMGPEYVMTEGFILEGDIVLNGVQAGGDQGRVVGSFGSLGNVAPLNEPPDCSEARPDQVKLWPPNKKFNPVKISGITDPDGDPVTISIDDIFQDEPVSSGKRKRFTPDAYGLGTNAPIFGLKDGIGAMAGCTIFLLRQPTKWARPVREP